MAVQEIYRIDKIVCPTPVGGSSGAEFHTLSNVSTKYNAKEGEGRAAGQVFPNFTCIEKQQPQIDFTTKALDIALGLCGLAGAAFTSPLSVYMKQASATGNTVRATANHKKAVLNSSLLYWSSIRLPSQGYGEVSFSLMANYDGTNDPLIFTGSITLPGTLAATNYFGAGPAYVNGIAIPGVQEITVNSGIKLVQKAGESEEFDTFIGVETGSPEVQIKTLQQVNWATLGLRGIKLNGNATPTPGTGLVFYGRKYNALGPQTTSGVTSSRVADATAEHIKFAMKNGMAIPVDSTGQETGESTDTLKIKGVGLGETDIPLIVTLLSAITAPSS